MLSFSLTVATLTPLFVKFHSFALRLAALGSGVLEVLVVSRFQGGGDLGDLSRFPSSAILSLRGFRDRGLFGPALAVRFPI